MNQLQQFSFNGSNTRIVFINGNPWWVAKDVCEILDLGNTTETIKRIDLDDLNTTEVIDSIGRKQIANIINESGLYQLIFMSRKPEAKAFRKWVTSEVLPQIRKTGSFGTPALPNNKQLALMVIEAEEAKEKLEALIIEQEPKVQLAERCLISDSLLSVAAAAKAIGTGQKKLFIWLRENGYLMANNLPYQQHIVAGLFEVKITPKTLSGVVHNFTQTFLTAKGLEKINAKFNLS